MNVYVLPNSPPLMSLGRRCMRDGFSFVWIAGQKPYVVRPGGKVIRLEVINDIPYFLPSNFECQPEDTKERVSMPYLACIALGLDLPALMTSEVSASRGAGLSEKRHVASAPRGASSRSKCPNNSVASDAGRGTQKPSPSAPRSAPRGAAQSLPSKSSLLPQDKPVGPAAPRWMRFPRLQSRWLLALTRKAHCALRPHR
jgi:hypothetical protein